MTINEKQKSWSISQEELNLRFDYMEGKISRKEFDRKYKMLSTQGKVIRNGRKVK